MSTLMKRTIIFGALLLCFGLSSCNCADPPPVGPVEDEEEAHLLMPDAPAEAVMLRGV
jgi:hypothetical protein